MPAPERKIPVRCLITKKWIRPESEARWSEELSGFVSKKGQLYIDTVYESGKIGSDSLVRTIWSEWWQEDNPQGGRVD
jgi:hypothetical protein